MNRIQVSVKDGRESEALVVLLFHHGYKDTRSRTLPETIETYKNYSVIYINRVEKTVYAYRTFFKETEANIYEFSANFGTILDFVIEPEFKKELKVNGSYTAIVTKGGVEVDCANFTLDKVIELAEICKEAKNSIQKE
jgi:hypothetical protein